MPSHLKRSTAGKLHDDGNDNLHNSQSPKDPLYMILSDPCCQRVDLENLLVADRKEDIAFPENRTSY